MYKALFYYLYLSGVINSRKDVEGHIQSHKFETKLSNTINDYHFSSPSRRLKRALIQFGQKAINFLLKGANLVRTNRHAQYYIKPGGYKQAVADFDSVQPINSQTKPHSLEKSVVIKRGQVGDRHLYVIPGDQNMPPYIAIFQDKGNPQTLTENSRKTKVIYYGNYSDIIKYLRNILNL